MKKISKTLLMGIGLVGASAAPIIATVSCGSGKTVRHFNLLPTYTGQEDQLIALGIGADYYPLQLNASSPYEYLTNPGKYMIKQSDDFKAKFAQKINSLIPSTKGTSWWNQQALKAEEAGSDPAYWQQQEAGVLMYEHYLLDDDSKIIDNSVAPKHMSEATVQTNFRWSRDPFTRIPKPVFFGWGHLTEEQVDKLIAGTLPHGEEQITINGETVTVTVADAKIIKALWNKSRGLDNKGESDWLYNDYYFVNEFHNMFLDNEEFHNSDFANWIIDSSTTSPFADDSLQSGLSAKLKALFDASTFQKDEIAGGVGPRSAAHVPVATPHHPIYEQQEGEVGAAPMFEGAMRDNQLYLFNVAWQLDNLISWGTPYGQNHYNSLPQTIKRDATNSHIKLALSKEEADTVKAYVRKQLIPQQITQIERAFENAVAISTDMHSRLAKLKSYINALKADASHAAPLKYGLLTIAPGGQGQSTIQTMSKYSFLYKELGFAQPVPTNIDELVPGANKFTSAWTEGSDKTWSNQYLVDDKVSTSDDQVNKAIGDGAMFNMDDNGWFWVVGQESNLDTDRLAKFAGQFDLGSIAARDVNYKAIVTNGNATVKSAVNGLFGDSNADKHLVDYDLWNEGLKTPFVMHMLLDQVQQEVEQWYIRQTGKSTEALKAFQASHVQMYNDATSWGNYFSNTYINQN